MKSKTIVATEDNDDYRFAFFISLSLSCLSSSPLLSFTSLLFHFFSFSHIFHVSSLSFFAQLSHLSLLSSLVSLMSPSSLFLSSLTYLFLALSLFNSRSLSFFVSSFSSSSPGLKWHWHSQQPSQWSLVQSVVS